MPCTPSTVQNSSAPFDRWVSREAACCPQSQGCKWLRWESNRGTYWPQTLGYAFKNKQNLYKLLRRVLHQSRHPAPTVLHLKPHDLKMFLYQFLPNSTGRLDSAAQKWQVRKALSDCLEYSELIPACAHSCGTAHTSHWTSWLWQGNRYMFPRAHSNYSQALGENKSKSLFRQCTFVYLCIL